MTKTPCFSLQFANDDDRETLSLILDYASRYLLNDAGAEKDARALQAGHAIRCGEYTKCHFIRIVEWKLEAFLFFKPERNLNRNEDEEIADALRLAVTAKTTRAAVSVLCGLIGVRVPVASALLTAIYPESYTVIDKRALHALGVETNDISTELYLAYLDACRKLAGRYHVELRTFDRALWRWSDEQPRTRRRRTNAN
jgi:hypothetical protein